jgi:hypothetical protein
MLSDSPARAHVLRRRSTRVSSAFLFALAGALSVGCAASVDDQPMGGESEGVASVEQAAIVPSSIIGAPAVASMAPNRLDLFARGADNALYHRTWTDGAWGAWVWLGGTLTSKPAAVASGDRIYVFVRGTDGALWMRSLRGTTWSPWTSLGGTVSTDGVAAVSDSPGNVRVFVRQPDDTVGTIQYPVFENVTVGSSTIPFPRWSTWSTIPGKITSAPSAVSMEPGSFDVFARGTDGALRVSHFPTTITMPFPPYIPFTTWSSWVSLGGSIVGGPAVAKGVVRDSIRAYARGTDGKLWTKYRELGSWSDWKPLGGALPSDGVPTSEPAAVALKGTCDHVFARNDRGEIWHKDCGESTTIELASPARGTSFRDTKASLATQAWTAPELSSITSPDDRPTTSAAVQGTWPRELVMVSHEGQEWPVVSPLFPVIPAWNAGEQNARFATLPAPQKASSGGFDLSPDVGSLVATTSVSMPVRAARVIDHGTCATRVVWREDWDKPYLTPGYGFFSEIDQKIYESFAKAAADAGATLYSEGRTFEPSFVRGASPGTQADGFSLRIRYKISKHVPSIGNATVTIDVKATYRMFLNNGSLDIAPVGRVAASVETNTLTDIGVLFGKSVPTRAEIQAQFERDIPDGIRKSAFAKSSQSLVIGCDRTRGEAYANQQCAGLRPLLASGAQAELAKRGISKPLSEIRSMVDALDDRGFKCLPPEGDDANDITVNGTCAWGPAFKRANVTPDALELVWYDGDTPSADFRFVQLVKPEEIGACTPTATTHPARKLPALRW